MSRRNFTPFWALLIFWGITIFFTYPVSLHPTELVLGRPFDDVFEHIWYLQWYKHALLDLQVSPLFQPDIFYPNGWDLGFASLPPLFPALMAPLTATIGPVATYNFLLISSTVGAAFGVFMLVSAMDGTFIGGIFAGVAYAFYPNRQVYMDGFLNHLLASMWLPWIVFALYQAVNNSQNRGRWLAFAVLAYALSIASAWQYVYIATLTLVVFSLLYLVPDILREWQSWKWPLFMAGLILIPTVGSNIAFGMIKKTQIGASTEFPLNDLIITSVSIERLIVPDPLNPIFRDFSLETFPLRNGEDGVVTLGLAVIVLAIVGIVTFNFKPRTRRTFVVLVIVGLLFMFGPFLQLQGQPVTVNWLPETYIRSIFPDLIAETGGVRVPMPAFLLYTLVPPLRSFHHFGRLGMVVALSLGTFAGLGITAIQKKLPPRAGMIVGFIAILVLMVEINPQPHESVTSIAGMHRTVDKWLLEQSDQNVIMEYPMWYSYGPQALYYSLVHQQKIVNGYSIITPEFQKYRMVLDQWPEEPAINLLEDYGVDYVLIHALGSHGDFSTNILPELMKNSRLEFVGRLSNNQPEDSIPSYWNGRIKPLQETMRVTYVFKLAGTR
jgi:hypothetical protein